MIVKFLFTFLFLTFPALSFNTPLENPDLKHQLDSLITSIIQKNNIPSVAVAVDIPGEAEYYIVKGKANLNSDLDRNFDDQFRIASITKTFAATAILILADLGKLKTSDKLSKWYPDFPNAEKITIRDLLMMRSGIIDYWNEKNLREFYNDPLKKISIQEMMDQSALNKPEFINPDTETIYNNLNYNILEQIIEKESGKKISVAMEELIFKPLELNSTFYPTDVYLPGNLRGYSFDSSSGQLVDKTLINPEPPGGAGAMISSMRDLIKHARALYRGDLLNPGTQTKRLQFMNLKGAPDFVSYGEGIIKIGNFYGHNGTIFGFSSEMFYLPDKDAVIVINVNRLDADDKSQSAELFFSITKLLFPQYVEW